VLVGPETADDAGIYLLDGTALVATADFITPVCDEPRRFGRVAAANSLSDVYAMGGEVLFALNLCCFPTDVPEGVLGEVLAGAAEKLGEAGGALLGGHTVRDEELKFGLSVIGRADPARLLTNAAAQPGDALVLTKPLGTGVLINAFRADRLDDEGFEAALVEMERLNAVASRLALAHGARAATDVTGFALAGHALGMARASGVAMRVEFATLPVHEAFYPLVARGITTGCTAGNRDNAEGLLQDRARLTEAQQELLFDPQTSGGLLIAIAATAAPALLAALLVTGHRAARVGEVRSGPPLLEIV
jgi:selenide, water dikinase